MRQDIIKQLDGYEKVLEEIKTSRKYNIDIAADKKRTAEYIRVLHPSEIELKISRVISETPSTKTLRLVPTGNSLPPFQAGQYISLFLEVDGIRTGRPYSISSQPNQTGYFDITIRRMEGGLVSNYLLDDIQPGDIINSSGPEGQFYYNPITFDNDIVCIAGGSGITPFMSMIREITDCGLDREVYLFYGNKSEDDIIFHQELQVLSTQFSNIHYIPVIENPSDTYKGLKGFISGAIIQDTVSDILNKTFMLCGPQALYDFCIPEIDKLGVPARKIKREIYGESLDIVGSPGWPKEVTADSEFSVSIAGGAELRVRAGDSLLSSLERNGIVKPFICRSGECSLCRTKVLSGKVYQPPETPVRKSDRQFGYVHACVSYPLEDLEIMI